MLYNEYNLILKQGVAEKDLMVFNPAYFGVNFPEDGLYVSQKAANEKPEIIKKLPRNILFIHKTISPPNQ